MSAQNRNQAGAILPLTLVFSLLLAMVSAGAMHTAGLQFRMAGNDQMLLRAQQRAQSIVNELTTTGAGFDLANPVGWSSCLAGSGMSSCDDFELTNPTLTPLPEGVDLRIRVTRLQPTLVELPLAARTEAHTPAWGALFEILVVMDGGGAGLASTQLATGVAVPVAGGTPLPVFWREPGSDAL
tara:strand:+ start:31438 stop:31986 length:549 start_codon:yes stop_codon:yes gene_type:complete